MRAAIITARQKVESREYPEPELLAGGAVVDGGAICGTGTFTAADDTSSAVFFFVAIGTSRAAPTGRARQSVLP